MIKINEKSNFELTKNAASRIAFLLNSEPKNSFFRLKVNGGGCSGFQYDFSFDKERSKEDLSFEFEKTEVVIDQISLSFLEGSKLDFINDLSGAYFQVQNPNASVSCGCGTSFSI